MNTLNFGVFIKEPKVLIMSPQWIDYENVINGFPAVGHNFGLKTIGDSMIIGKCVKFIFGDDDKSVLFGSKFSSIEVDMERVYVWNKGKLINVADKKQVESIMVGKFLKAF